jgi:hypothetical protein
MPQPDFEMRIASGIRIGPYEVKSPLGEGGMGIGRRALHRNGIRGR